MNEIIIIVLTLCVINVNCNSDQKSIWFRTDSSGPVRFPTDKDNRVRFPTDKVEKYKVDRTANEQKDYKNFDKLQQLYPPNCGFSNGTHDRVVNGVPASLGSWPWMAALGFRIDDGDKPIEIFFCGGSLITDRHVITAAHCLSTKDVIFVVRLGEENLESNTDGAHPVDFDIQQYTIHPKFNEAKKENDIAILKLNKTVIFSRFIHPICLPLAPEIRNINLVNYSPFLAGWGSTRFGGPTSDILLETQVFIVDNNKCRSQYKNYSVVIDDRVLCAGFSEGRTDACQGDSGGPLMIPDSHSFTWYLVGVVSNGLRCALRGYPGIYTRVSAFIDFILTNIQ